jgi:hypothetical protein
MRTDLGWRQFAEIRGDISRRFLANDLEIVVGVGSTIDFFWRDFGPAFVRNGPTPIAADGISPVLIQSRFGAIGNFELLAIEPSPERNEHRFNSRPGRQSTTRLDLRAIQEIENRQSRNKLGISPQFTIIVRGSIFASTSAPPGGQNGHTPANMKTTSFSPAAKKVNWSRLPDRLTEGEVEFSIRISKLSNYWQTTTV